MYIDQITLTNFRGYHGENTLIFSTDSFKNISIVAGNNGFGKTTLLTALIWGLYGKLMVDVDEIYRNEINQAGGYKSYCNKIMSRLAIAHRVLNNDYSDDNLEIKSSLEKPAIEEYFFGTSIVFSQLSIPHLPCEKVDVTRRFFPDKGIEKLEILIDGKVNELTKSVGSEIFINDFILPKEIAKFFFFDAEKIVSMAEIRNTEQKRYLSKAYAEVLGIKKYTDLKANLENLQYRLRKKSAVKGDRDKLAHLNKQIQQTEKLLKLYNQQIEEKQKSLNSKKIASDKYQEQLIREGSTLTPDELKKLKAEQIIATNKLNAIKAEFNEMLDLAPFAMVIPVMEQVKQQLENEANNSSIAASLLESKFQQLTQAIQSQRSSISSVTFNEDALFKIIKATLIPDQINDSKALLDFTAEQQNGFFNIYTTIKGSYRETFKKLVADQRREQAIYQNIQKKLRKAEKTGSDAVVIQIWEAKQKLDNEIMLLENDLNQLNAKTLAFRGETATLNRQISELSKNIAVEDKDLKKDQTTGRLIAKLDEVINKLKTSKKQSLEVNLEHAFNQLMHKANFIKRVNVIIEGDLIDIELLDSADNLIEKDSLSKGEQQLYATALLKALIEESNINFPVFIDSPLQKFDKLHSKNIINDFYPNLSSQVVLFPLLQKELTKDEYDLLMPYVGKTYLISQVQGYGSRFNETAVNQLFDAYNRRMLNV